MAPIEGIGSVQLDARTGQNSAPSVGVRGHGTPGFAEAPDLGLGGLGVTTETTMQVIGLGEHPSEESRLPVPGWRPVGSSSS